MIKQNDQGKEGQGNSGAGNGRANFMGAWHFFTLSAGKPPPHARKIPPLGGGSCFFLEGGGWKCRFYFYGREDFSE